MRLSFHPGRLGALLLGALLLVLALHYGLPGLAGPSLAPALPQDPYIQVYFNQSPAAAYTDPYRRIQRHGDDLEAMIVAAIAAANTSIDVAVQEINLPRVAIALRDQAQAGLAVRVIVEDQYNRPWQPLAEFQSAQLDEYQQSKQAERQQLIDANRNGKITAQELEKGDAIRILTKAQVPLID
ncbi:MAG: competence protein ComE, partial [Cyanobacteria bacterium P01_D01_bin.115]